MSPKIKSLSILHILNDGFQACILIILPFIANDMHLNLVQVGILGGSLNVIQIILALPAGLLAYRFGGYRLLLAALLLYCLGFASIALSPIYILIIAAFIFSGIGFGIFHPIAFAEVANNSDKSSRGKIMGNFTAIGDVGRMVFTSIITFLVVSIGWRNSILIYSILGLGTFIVLFKKVVKIKDKFEPKKSINHDDSLINYIKNKRFVLSMASDFFDSLASSSLFVFIPFLFLFRGIDPKILGILTSTFFIGNILGKTAMGKLTDKLGGINVFIISEVLMFLIIILLSYTTYLPLIIISAVILGFFTKGTAPVIITIISESLDGKHSFEKGFGIEKLVTGISNMMSPIILGLTADKFGINYAFGVSAIFALLATIPAFIYTTIDD